MKKNILTLIFLVSGLSTYAFNAPIGVSTADQKITINFEGLTLHGAKVLIKNLDGIVIFSNAVKPRVQAKIFNLSELPIDRYVLSIENDQKIVDQLFTLKNNSIEMDDLVSQTFKPSFKSINEHIAVSTLLLGKQAIIEITDSQNNMLYNESFNDEALVNRIYSIKNLSKGGYTLSVYLNDKTFNYFFEK